MSVTCRHEGFSHTQNLECPKEDNEELEAAQACTPQERAVLGAMAKAHFTRWNPCIIDDEDADGPVYQGFLTDADGRWVQWDDIAEAVKAELARREAAK